ncbi:hypothetical protein Cgig2_005267 [Carnegiea gigantea]|uniref:rRNA N-glycosylase n=1 Tax=Carnegiea gigantea TaxID=171969 RepID=A0A9Q1GG05_9CARY|nr:hypothetical protein Cgig2_005267 [Carnegiea gigantea]
MHFLGLDQPKQAANEPQARNCLLTRTPPDVGPYITPLELLCHGLLCPDYDDHAKASSSSAVSSSTSTVLPFPSSQPRYRYIELVSNEHNSITLAINMDTINVVGYSNPHLGCVRARFFSDAPDYAKQNLFPHARGHLCTEDIGYFSNYDSLEGVALLWPESNI